MNEWTEILQIYKVKVKVNINNNEVSKKHREI